MANPLREFLDHCVVVEFGINLDKGGAVRDVPTS